MISAQTHEEIGRYGLAERSESCTIPMRGVGPVGALSRDMRRKPKEGMGAVREVQSSQVEQGSSFILFPVAVGAIFLTVLVVGALLG